MIQRIQTLYLFLIVVLQSILLLSNIAKYIADEAEIICYTKDLGTVAILTSLTALIPAISMFMYKKRIRQMRFNIFNSIILVALQGFIIYYIIGYINKSSSFIFSLPSIFPVISLILSILAIRNILKDELLIKSLNRIRK
ncbi:MAG: DUF4293 domain-containing protein [Prevotellaceae bacterium]|jgi:hypothetical protein|nr:DUF4293 domain-containing protein [Prevotellaceae bacterium]